MEIRRRKLNQFSTKAQSITDIQRIHTPVALITVCTAMPNTFPNGLGTRVRGGESMLMLNTGPH